MAERPARKPRTLHTGQVIRTERLTPHMRRVVLGGEGLAAFGTAGYTDHYVKLLFPVEGVDYPEPFDVQRIREEYPREQWPVSRTYTVRAWDPEARELTLDFVIHGEEGIAGPGRPGPGPATCSGSTVPAAPTPPTRRPTGISSPGTSALPALAAALEALPAGAVAHAFLEVSGPEEEQKFDSDAQVTWLHRGERPVGEALVEAVRALEPPPGGCTPSCTARPAS